MGLSLISEIVNKVEFLVRVEAQVEDLLHEWISFLFKLTSQLTKNYKNIIYISITTLILFIESQVYLYFIYPLELIFML